MAGEKTEQPTPKRLQDSRKKGQVSKSRELTLSVLFFSGAAVLACGGPAYMEQLKAVMLKFFQPGMLTGQLSLDVMLKHFGEAFGRGLLLLAPLLGSLFVTALVLDFLQVKALFAPE